MSSQHAEPTLQCPADCNAIQPTRYDIILRFRRQSPDISTKSALFETCIHARSIFPATKAMRVYPLRGGARKPLGWKGLLQDSYTPTLAFSRPARSARTRPTATPRGNGPHRARRPPDPRRPCQSRRWIGSVMAIHAPSRQDYTGPHRADAMGPAAILHGETMHLVNGFDPDPTHHRHAHGHRQSRATPPPVTSAAP